MDGVSLPQIGLSVATLAVAIPSRGDGFVSVSHAAFRMALATALTAARVLPRCVFAFKTAIARGAARLSAGLGAGLILRHRRRDIP